MRVGSAIVAVFYYDDDDGDDDDADDGYANYDFPLGTSAYKRQRGASVGPMEKKHELVDREVLGVRVQGDIKDEFKLLHRLELRQGKLLWVPEVQVCAEEVEDGTDRPFWVPESAWCLRGRGFTEAPHALPKEALQIDMHEHSKAEGRWVVLPYRSRA